MSRDSLYYVYIYTSDVTVYWEEFSAMVVSIRKVIDLLSRNIRQGVDILATASGYRYIIIMTEGKRKRKIENIKDTEAIYEVCSGF